jgi:lysophospholipase L1-like esterase
VIIVALLGTAEGLLRVVGVSSAPPLPPRLLVREIDTDITLPFMREDPELFWSPRPGFQGAFRGAPVTINSLGLRGPEVALPKPAGRKRIVCFGDSITFGYGVGDDDTYSHDLGRLLASRGVDVVNAGVTGYTSHQVLGLLRRVAPLLRTDVATICIGWNDGNRRPVTDRGYERRYHLATSAEGALDRIYIYRAMKAAYLRVALRRLPSSGGQERVPLPEYRENLAAIVSECRAHGIRPVFIAPPARKKAGEPVLRTPRADALRAVAAELGVAVLETGDLGLTTRLDSNAEYFIDGLHFSPAGAERMAEELARQLEALGIV